MTGENTENKRRVEAFLEKLASARRLIRRKRYKEANVIAQGIYENDQYNIEAEKLLSFLEKRRKIWNFRVMVVSIFLVTVAFFAFLTWKEVSSTEISIDLVVKQLSFTLSRTWNLYGIETVTFGISHLEDLELEPKTMETAVAYDPKTDQPIRWRSVNFRNPIQIKRTQDFWNVSIQSNYLKLSSLSIDSGATVTLAVNEQGQGQNQILISIIDGTAFGAVETNDTLMLSCNGCQVNAQFEVDANSSNFRIVTREREIQFRDLHKSIDIILRIPHPSSNSKPYVLGKSIDIKNVDFTVFEGDKRESTIIQDSKIYFAELDRKEFDIRNGDFVFIEELEDFTIKRLILNNQMQVSLQGRVRDLKSGTKAFLYSRLPSYLEWLQTNQSISIFFATLIPIFSLILATFYRLKIIDI